MRHRTPETLRRRDFLLGASTAVLSAGGARAAEARAIVVYKSPSCGCCGGWVTHMRRAGFSPRIIDVDDLGPIRIRRSVPASLAACHTAEVGGYVVEGHVPPADVIRLLRERPRAVGLIVAGMPTGSPGMESPTGAREAYSTLLLLPGGRTRVYARHT